MTIDKNLAKNEWIVIILAVSIIPLLSLLVGDAIISLYIEGADILIQMFSERVLFVFTALSLYFLLRYLLIFNEKLHSFINTKECLLYIIQVLIILVFIQMIVDSNEPTTYTLIYLLLNYLIAWEEEFLYRGIVPSLLKNVIRINFLILIIQGLIFTFIAHIESTFIDNLIYRFPLSLVLYQIKVKFNSIYYPVTIHAVWNIFLSYV
ncbi:CPBP family intramembrane glutamic endopeptidase [Mammaliicoccus lentus]|uniref:CPBP family intramembrane glutamic endopeptidase n=1 Tax=Mammaliicoccus lentus TaxID=42858 RepID=UPI001B31F349|nr:CPBP family intramembrane glutamic endopeptidase [Mammaliicoccus lentus]